MTLSLQHLRHADRGKIVSDAWGIAKATGATIEERHAIYEREIARLSHEFEHKWGVPA